MGFACLKWGRVCPIARMGYLIWDDISAARMKARRNGAFRISGLPGFSFKFRKLREPSRAL